MSFFKEVKDDLSQAVNDLIPDDRQEQEEAEDQMVNTLDVEELDEKSASDKINEWLNEIASENELEESLQLQDEFKANTFETEIETVNEDESESMDDNVDLELLRSLNDDQNKLIELRLREATGIKVKASSISNDDETVVTKGTNINGNISTDGSIDIMGTVNGDVKCLGKLSVTGKVSGNLEAADVYVNMERLEGNITSEGNIKVGLGTIVIGDIKAVSGVIAGAVKGEIDINGPILIDSTAIIKGNIKAKSIQINNGAIVEGYCSLSNSAVNIDSIFE